MTYSGPIRNPDAPKQGPMGRSVQVAKAGASFGSALAITISWSQHHSIVWAVFQGFLSWFYVLYFALTRS